jgi:hypothetical protein
LKARPVVTLFKLPIKPSVKFFISALVSAIYDFPN